ncbi:MAG: hypothetical protein AAFX01_13150 [Cyanobacteria bacterium J06638_28]
MAKLRNLAKIFRKQQTAIALRQLRQSGHDCGMTVTRRLFRRDGGDTGL